MNNKTIRLGIFTLAFISGQLLWAASADPQAAPDDSATPSNSSATTTNNDSTTTTSGSTMAADSDSCTARLQNMLQSLNLTDDQQTKVNAIIAQTTTANAPYKQQLQTLQNQIKQLITGDSLNEQQLDSIITQKKNIMGSMLRNKIMAKYQIYQLLNSQQKTQFQQQMSTWGQQNAS